jgi:branched-chain amino acid transport system permease protein
MPKKIVKNSGSLKYFIMGLIIVCALPIFIRDSYFLYVFILGGIYALLAGSYDLLGGYTGQLSFGHAAFFGIGAYTSALLALNIGISPYFCIIIGGISAGLFGLVVGASCLRLHGPYFSIATLGFAETVRLIITNEEKITRGPLGLSVCPLPGAPQAPLSFHIFNFYIMVIVLLICFWLMNIILKSQIGLCLRAVREDETTAQATGINITKYKIIAFILSSFFAGIAGGFYAHYILLISPSMLTPIVSFTIIAIVMFGGLGTLFGPLLAAFILTFINEYLRGLMLYRPLIFSGVLIFVVTFMPQGIMGILKSENIKNKLVKEYLKYDIRGNGK